MWKTGKWKSKRWWASGFVCSNLARLKWAKKQNLGIVYVKLCSFDCIGTMLWVTEVLCFLPASDLGKSTGSLLERVCWSLNITFKKVATL